MWSALPAVAADAPLPNEFRIFTAGVNASTKGDVLFDALAAELVLEAYRRGGVDLMIDLAHDSLSEAARVARADADDARGWFQLEVRAGELWAVGVTWTPDGERRLRERTQRYISPAFRFDDAGRVVELINVAIVARPATLDAPALVARRSAIGGTVDPKLIKEALDALEAGDSAKALEILKALIASAAGAEVEAPPAADPVEESADPPAPSDEPLEQARAAGTPDELATLRAEVAALSAERDARDLDERRGLVARLVVLGAETPATAWSGDAARRQPCERLAREPLGSLRARVAALAAARPANAQHEPPVSGSAALSSYEERLAAGMTPVQRERFLALRATRAGRDVTCG